jgi:hypothetical protein
MEYWKAIDQRWKHQRNGGLIGIGTKEELEAQVGIYLDDSATNATLEDVIYEQATPEQYAQERADCGY